MRFFHLSDLHIGRQLHFYSLAEDQRRMLDQIVEPGSFIQMRF